MKFDPANKVFEISVRELAEDEGFHRIGFAQTGGWNRLGLGTELHARVLQARRSANPNYRAEVFLQAEIPCDGWKAIITGRLDGCVQREGNTWLIEEFKSSFLCGDDTRRNSPAFDEHRRQLLIYCHLWRGLGNSPVHGALVYVDIVSGKEVTHEIAYDAGEQEKEIQLRLKRILALWAEEEKIRALKAAAANVLPFPHAAPRPGQQKIIESVLIATHQRENLIAEAPTGSGKTAASLHPALAEGLRTGRQVVFLTSKTLQQKMAVSALTAMNSSGAFHTLQIRAKEKMCANDRVICHEDFCPYAKNYPDKMTASKILERLRSENSHLDPDTIFAEAKREKVCPFEVQLELASRADAIVADYNYVFDPGVALRHLSREELDNVILLIDEAHNLPDRARKIFSPELLEENFRDAGMWIKQLRDTKPRRKTRKSNESAELWDQPAVSENTDSPESKMPRDLADAIDENLGDGLDLLQNCAAKLPVGEAIAETQPPEQALKQLWKSWEPKFLQYLLWKRESKFALTDDPIVDLHFSLQRFLATLTLFGPGFSCVVERRSAGIRVAIICLDPARPLGPIFRATSSTTLLSATLSPTEVIQRTLGLEKNRTASISLPPPFPHEHRKVMILPQVRTTFAARERNFPKIAQLIAEMSDAQNGNVLVLFPSYTFLEKVAERMPGTRAQLLIQRASFSDTEREKIFQILTAPPPNGILLFAVLGGMYAEGVDYPGELLSGVFVISPGLPQLSFERELLRRYFEETEGTGFEYAYLQPGMTRVVQAAGRLIRSETDRGVIALLCQRFLQEPYTKHLPRDWFNHSPAELIAQNPADEVRKFFAGR